MSPPRHPDSESTVILAGVPNVGKSATFNALTGRYVTVSNYPGTTVEVSRGHWRAGDRTVEVIDTPGMYGLLSITDEERVARRILLDAERYVVVHVIDAKNVERMLPLTLQLLELRVPLVVALNMMDEAEAEGVRVDVEGLSRFLGVRVVPMVATERRGIDALEHAILDAFDRTPPGAPWAEYDDAIETGLRAATEELRLLFPGRARALALLLMQGDEEVRERVTTAAPDALTVVDRAVEEAGGDADAVFRITERRYALCRGLVGDFVHVPPSRGRRAAEWLNARLIEPWTGIPVLLLVLYLGLYKFVGQFGAGTVVDWLESSVFGEHLIPWVDTQVRSVLSADDGWQYWGRELIVGDYGIVTLGVTYAIAIVLPIVGLFFLFFSVLEDSGYFPRLALLVDRAFKRIGLNGRAVIPVVLGFACDTMATMVTRVQETRRERVITTMLLALAIPCSAQYGVIAAMLAAQGGGVLGMSTAFIVWAAIMLFVFLGTGWVASRVVSGKAAEFYMELPPLRMPRPTHVLTKTFARMKWYFVEILPLFVLASVLIWIGRLTGLFDLLIRGLEPVVGALGLPAETAPAFLYGFFRRDFGAAGLYDLAETGALSSGQLLVACTTLTLFLPCIAQLLIMHKERGFRTTATIAATVVVVAFGVGGALHGALMLTGGW